MKGTWTFYLILTGLWLYSCTGDVEIQPGPGTLDTYYPIKVGDIRNFAIDSITYDYDGNLQQIVIDTQQFYLQERVLGTVEIQGSQWYRIGLFQGNDQAGPYDLSDYAYEQVSETRLLRREGHLTFIPLASPLSLFTEWDGTAYFDAENATRFIKGEIVHPYSDWTYLYIQKWDDFILGQQKYADVIQINQRDTLALEMEGGGLSIPPEKQLFYNLANEFYAPHIGLIFKEEYNLTSICASSNVEDFQAFCDTTTIFEHAERGYIYRKKLLSIE